MSAVASPRPLVAEDGEERARGRCGQVQGRCGASTGQVWAGTGQMQTGAGRCGPRAAPAAPRPPPRRPRFPARTSCSALAPRPQGCAGPGPGSRPRQRQHDARRPHRARERGPLLGQAPPLPPTLTRFRTPLLSSVCTSRSRSSMSSSGATAAAVAAILLLQDNRQAAPTANGRRRFRTVRGDALQATPPAPARSPPHAGGGAWAGQVPGTYALLSPKAGSWSAAGGAAGRGVGGGVGAGLTGPERRVRRWMARFFQPDRGPGKAGPGRLALGDTGNVSGLLLQDANVHACSGRKSRYLTF